MDKFEIASIVLILSIACLVAITLAQAIRWFLGWA